MKRLINPAVDGGLPYMNMDFTDVLQTQHLKSYSAMLDGLNDVPLDSSEMDRGIVLTGINVISFTEFSNTISLTGSMIYIPDMDGYGDYYEPSPELLGSDVEVLSSEFYLITESTFEKRYLKSGSNEDLLEKKYFKIVTDKPTDNIPYIKFYSGKTNRRYSRILKYKLSNNNQIFVTSNLSNFNQITGLGEGDMFGFALCDGQPNNPGQKSYQVGDDLESIQTVETNSTYDLRGRYVMGYDKSSCQFPLEVTSCLFFDDGPQFCATTCVDSTGKMNYATIGNKGGGTYLRCYDGDTIKLCSGSPISPNQLPIHNHGGCTGEPDDVSHTHYIETGDDYSASSGGPSRYGRGSAAKDGQLYFNNCISAFNNDYQNLCNHIHQINFSGTLNSIHETRPPYMVFAYYQKINLVYS